MIWNTQLVVNVKVSLRINTKFVQPQCLCVTLLPEPVVENNLLHQHTANVTSRLPQFTFPRLPQVLLIDQFKREDEQQGGLDWNLIRTSCGFVDRLGNSFTVEVLVLRSQIISKLFQIYINFLKFSSSVGAPFLGLITCGMLSINSNFFCLTKILYEAALRKHYHSLVK